MMRSRPSYILVLVLLSFGCSDQTIERVPPAASTPPADEPPDETPDAGPDGADAGSTTKPKDASAPPPPATDAGSTPCAKVFGNAITPVFGRLDGVVHRVTVPGDKTCQQDDNHVLVQIDADGATYTVWIDVESTFAGDQRVSIATTSASLVGPAWASGWHPTPSALDYPTTLGIHSDGPFQALDIAALSSQIAASVKPGAKVSAYISGFATNDGGHKVHRNGQNDDGAIVILGSGTPSWLLFRFADQMF